MIDFGSIGDLLTTKAALWWALGLFTVFFITMSAILTYHWRPYYEIDKHVRGMRLVHHIGGTILIIAAALILIFA